MTSIATYLASLTGAAPQEGQKGTLANAPGAAGLFAALLESSEATQGIDGETTLLPDTFELPVAAPNEQVTNDAAALREALTNGLDLSRDGADIDAAIIDAPLTGETARGHIEAPLTGEAAQDQPLLPAAQPESEDQAPQNTQALVQPAVPEAPEEAPIRPVIQDETRPVEPRRHQAPETSARPAGLENALDRASQTGKENGLQMALSRAAQARGAGDTRQPDAARRENTSDASRINAPGRADDTPAIKPGTSRSEFAPKGPKIIQRLIQSGNGQSIIQIQERPVSETVVASSPPTLTVSVQAPVASPGPASATPHVPVSALAVTIAQQASNGAKRFNIRLDPPELGRIEVRLDVSREGQVTTHLVVERAETLDLLQRDARQLERALQNAGLDMSEEGMKFSLKDQDLAHGGDDHFPENDMGAQTGTEKDDLSLIPDDEMPPPTRYLATSGLDIRI